MRTVKILLYASGENQGTYDIQEVYNEEKHKDLLKEKCARFISHDFDQTVEVDKYRTVTVNAPDWFHDNWIIRTDDFIKLRWLIGFGFKAEWDELRYLKLTRLSMKDAFYVIKLVNSNPRSEFKKSLKEQAIDWLDSRKNTFRSPFTDRQWGALYNKWDNQKYDSIDRRLYNTKTIKLF